MTAALWIFFVIVTAYVIIETTTTASVVEGFNCQSNEWITCLDVSASSPNYAIRDYATANTVIKYLQQEVQDISSRYLMTWSLSPVTMITETDPPYKTFDKLNTFYSKPDQVVAVNGQVPNVSLAINYPAPLKGLVGATGPRGPSGDVGATGPEGAKGDPGYTAPIKK